MYIPNSVIIIISKKLAIQANLSIINYLQFDIMFATISRMVKMDLPELCMHVLITVPTHTCSIILFHVISHIRVIKCILFRGMPFLHKIKKTYSDTYLLLTASRTYSE